MLHRPAVPSSPEPPSSMGRKRTTNFDLPPRLQRKGTSYYYVCSSKPRKWLPLGRDLAVAKRRWAELEGGTASGLTVGQLVQQFVDREKRSETTRTQYASYQRTLEAEFPIPAAQLTSRHVALWRELQGARKHYANGCIALLLSSCRLGHELGQCERLTVAKWDVEPRDRDLLPAEFKAIRAAAPPWLQVAMDLAYLTGARPSDILALRWDKVTPDGILLRQRKTKHRQEFALSEELAAALQRARERPILGLFVVANARGRPITRNMLSHAWLAARTAAGVPDAQFRDIRALSAKAAKEGGQDYQALLGHTTRAMSERYIKSRETARVEPVRRKL